jgi:PAS domain S-box-containing protein
LSRLTLALGLALLALEATVSVAIIAATSEGTTRWSTIVFVLVVGTAFVVSGLVALSRRPENRTGLYLAAVGYLAFLTGLGASSSEWIFAVGYALEGLIWVPFTAVVLAYPTGLLQTRIERTIPVAVGALLTSTSLLMLLFDPTPAPSRCETCPESPMLIADRPGIATAADLAASLGGLALVAAGAVVLVRRWRGASTAQRRLLWPVLTAGFVVLGSVALLVVADHVSETATEVLQVVFLIALTTVPLGFLFGILRLRLARSSIADMVTALQQGVQLRDALARALSDPSVAVFYRLDPTRGLGGAGWVDVDGNGVPAPSPTAARAVEYVEQDDVCVAALVHDASLADEHELVQAVTAAAGMALHNERLQAELRAEVRLAGAFADTAPSLISNVDTDGRILKLNLATLRASGYSDEAELRGKFFWDVFIDPAERDEMMARFSAAAPDFPETEYENSFVNARGEQLVIYWHSAPVLDEQGRVVSIVAGGLDITERHQLEAEKEREREFLNAIANNAPSMICLIDDAGRLTDRGANIAFERTLERSHTDIGGEVFWMRYAPPSDADAIRERIERVVAGETLGEQDNYWVTATGRRLLVAWTCTPLPQLDERRLFLITGVDVTERKRRELEVQSARDFLQTVVSTIPSLLVVVDSEALIIENGINRAFTETFGWEAWESTGRSFLELVHPEDEYAVRMAIAAAANGVPRTDLEARWLRQGGEAAIVAWTATPTRDREGRAQVLLSGMDITERKRREEEIRAGEERLRAAIESAPVAILEVDLDLEVRLWNPGAERIFGWTADEVVGGRVPIVPTELRDEFVGLLDQIRDGSSFMGLETVRLRKDGTLVDVEVSAAPIRDATGEVAGYMAVFSDITQRKRQDEEIKASRARLVAAGDDARRRLERNLHDGAQQRLVALSVSLRLAESKLTEEPAASAALLAGAREELTRALEELRELARGIHPAILTDRGLAPAVSALAARSPVPVTVAVTEERLPAPVEAASYYVVAEALTNVAKYAGACDARVSVTHDDGRVVVEVADSGAGGADAARGSGLSGLADRVASLDGVLSVESPEGGGTVVRAEIPVAETAAKE